MFSEGREGGLLAILISAEAVQWKEPTMFPAIPAAAEPLVQAIGVAFTEPTLRRFCALTCGLIVTMGRRTVSHTLPAMGPMRAGHWSTYHRIYSSARFSMWKLAAALVRQVIALLPAHLPI